MVKFGKTYPQWQLCWIRIWAPFAVYKLQKLLCTLSRHPILDSGDTKNMLGWNFNDHLNEHLLFSKIRQSRISASFKAMWDFPIIPSFLNFLSMLWLVTDYTLRKQLLIHNWHYCTDWLAHAEPRFLHQPEKANWRCLWLWKPKKNLL